MTSRKRSKSRAVKMPRISDEDINRLNFTAGIAIDIIESMGRPASQIDQRALFTLANNYLALYQQTLKGVSTFTNNSTIH